MSGLYRFRVQGWQEVCENVSRLENGGSGSTWRVADLVSSHFVDLYVS